MYIPVIGRRYVFIPVDGPGDPTTYAVPEACLMPDDGSEPGEADWIDAAWIDGQVAVLVGQGAGATAYPAGQYMAWVRLTAGQEQVPLRAGRVRVGDTRP